MFFYIIVVLAISLFLLCFIANKANDVQIYSFGFIYYLTDIITINEIVLRSRSRRSSLISYADRHTYVCRQLLTKHALSRVRNCLLAIYKQKKPPFQVTFFRLWSRIWHTVRESSVQKLPWSKNANASPLGVFILF